MPSSQSKGSKVKVVYTDKHKLQNTDQIKVLGNPFETEEVPARAEAILGAIREVGWGMIIPPVDHGMAPIQAVHDGDYLNFLQTAYAENAAFFKEEGPVFTWTFANRQNLRKPKSFLAKKGYYCFSWGTPILKGTWEAAYWSAQCALTAAELVQGGERAVYTLCRPPGHHAAADLYGGFCYLNNAAIAARFLGERTAILDIDYHHGNGTQSIFYDDPNVVYCSLHIHPDYDYPFYWGDEDETGEGPGLGTNRNFPLPIGTDDSNYLPVLERALEFVSDFKPRYLIVSAGMDTIGGDTIGTLNLTTGGLQTIGRNIASLNLPTVIVQEGGYLVERLGHYVTIFLDAFGG